jgi:hypothetical protein
MKLRARTKAARSRERVLLFAPALRAGQLALLRSCPYDDPRLLPVQLFRVARPLFRLGLLEQDPTCAQRVRLTTEGVEVITLWAAAGF